MITKKWTLTLGIVAMAALLSLSAESATTLPTGGTSLLPAGMPTSAGFWSGPGGTVGTNSMVNVTHPDFSQAVHVEVLAPAGNYWQGTVNFNSTQAVTAGDVALMRVFFRSITPPATSGTGFAKFYAQGPAPTYTKYVVKDITSDGEWVEYLYPFVIGDSLPAGDLTTFIGFGGGTETQTFEVGGFELLNYGTSLTLEELEEAILPIIPPGGVDLLPAGMPQSAGFWKGGDPGVGTKTIVSANHPDFSHAIRVNVTDPTGQLWNGSITIPANQAVVAGDVCLAHLFFRSISSQDESGLGFASVFSGPGSARYIIQEVTAIDDEWVEYYIPYVIGNSHATGDLKLQVGFGTGNDPQVFEIGGFEWINYGSSLTIDDLPVTKATYVGRETNATWRAEAAARIEQHRKGDLNIQVVDDQGQAADSAAVTVEFQKHAYHFGSVVVPEYILGTNTDSIKYRETVLEMFNQSGTENATKWQAWIGEYGASFTPDQSIPTIQWLQDNDIYTRGHVMVWPSKNKLPSIIQAYLPEGDPASANPAAKQMVLDHIEDIATNTAPFIQEWDVLNEPYANHYLMDAFGDQVMVDWFDQSRQFLPTQKLYINDYGILTSGGRDIDHQQNFEDNIRYLVDHGAPIDGIGMQGHFKTQPTGIPTIYSVLERFSTNFPGLDIRVTEFDISGKDPELQVDFLRDFLTIMFSHPATVGVQNWGFWAGRHFRPEAAFYDEDWTPRPIVAEWKRLLFEEWWNDFAGTADAEGRYACRGYYGEYTITVEHGGESNVVTYVLSPDGPEAIAIPTSTPTSPEDSVQWVMRNEGGTNRLSAAVTIAAPGGLMIDYSTDLTEDNWIPFFKVDDADPNLIYIKSVDAEQASAFLRLRAY